MSPLLITPLLAASSCIILLLFAQKVFPRIGLVDSPKKYGLKRRPLPYPTGMIPVGVFLIVLLGNEFWNRQIIGIAISIILLLIVTFLDDRFTVAPVTRLGVHVMIGLILFLTGTHIYTLTNPLESMTGIPLIPLDIIDITLPYFGTLPFLSGLFTIGWIVFTINALNWFDGIAGQVSSLTTIGFLTIGFLALSTRVDQSQLALLTFSLAGISFSCLLFDFPPARMLMGDTGAMFFGLMLGILTIFAGGKVATGFLVLGLPLIDCLIVSMWRILKRKSPFLGSRHGEHLHHLLLEKGWSESQIITLTAVLGSGFGVTALFLSTGQKFIAALIFIAIVLMLSRYARTSL
ncbi:hypothetical protein A3D11_04320 [Candidatus Peribacteria bacterium RIFCSPHIGHO2_02_FULL_49_16]|nr:MAG: hypothetical protein A2880_03885 [Candidatus Peribacteria bacterium RIFCSPHIGHO2_01_FULL_49_38]OGJ58929.1 MAG: hypothetical protein A3D11_04320 [Candidatus Peribacteria bacterium RIFCSPHIGHO2_02_FULL_49_16]